VLLLLGAFAAHLDAFAASDTGRLFGYVKEINWGLNYVLPIPVALFVVRQPATLLVSKDSMMSLCLKDGRS
jgi:hypothetical protein